MKTVQNVAPGIQTVVALEDGNLITGTVSHVAHDVLEDAKARHNAGLFGTSEMRHAARVDASIVEKYLNNNGLTFQEFSRSEEHKRRFLMDPAIAGFRIWKGRI